MSLWSCVAEELATRCCTSATRDITTVARRFEHEGLWFLAVTLSDYGKAVEKWLDRGSVGPQSDLPGFRWDSRTGLPRFLGGFLRLVFEPGSGRLLDKPDMEAIFAIRQLTKLFSKVALPGSSNPKREGSSRQRVVSSARESKAMSEYIQCESDVREADAQLSDADKYRFCQVSDMLFASVLARCDHDVAYGRLLPKHGPGSTADRVLGNKKYDDLTWTSRLDKVFPLGDYLLPNYRFFDRLEKADIREPGAETPVRVITVPKTLKTPRIIAMEPVCMQYMQQAILRSLLESLKEDDFLNRTIGFDDQDPNRVMARKGSLTGDLATLDLSEASDRVSYQHVRLMLRNHPHLLEAVDASRSRKADVPGHGVIRLAKYASMGSALCFPMEAMVFTTIIFMGILESSRPLNRRSLVKRYSGRVRVFGDDLIVPVDKVLSVVNNLETFGLRVNVGKSFWTGRFRESCGREYYAGQDVSIVKVRSVLPTQRQDATGVIAAVSLRNQFYLAGLWQTARRLDEYLGKLLTHFPTVAPTAPVLGRVSFLGYETQKQHSTLHSPLVKGWYVQAEPPPDSLGEEGALLKCLLRMEARNWADPSGSDTSGDHLIGGQPPADTEHLERSGRPKHVGIRLGWRSPF